jgi:hypothetical protein
MYELKKEEIVDNYQVDDVIYEVNETEALQTEESIRSSSYILNSQYKEMNVGSIVST